MLKRLYAGDIDVVDLLKKCAKKYGFWVCWFGIKKEIDGSFTLAKIPTLCSPKKRKVLVVERGLTSIPTLSFADPLKYRLSKMV